MDLFKCSLCGDAIDLEDDGTYEYDHEEELFCSECFSENISLGHEYN